MKLERILVPVDFSPSSKHAVEYATFLAQRCAATIDVMHVWQPPRGFARSAGPPDAAEERRRTFEEFVRSNAAKRMAEMLSAVETRRVFARGRLAFGDPCDAIVAVAPLGYDLIVMASRGRSHVIHRIFGGLAAKIADLAACPVVIVHAA
jgi:universal stress protein A